MASRLNTLHENLTRSLGGQVVSLVEQFGELTLTLRAADAVNAMQRLHDEADLRFEQLSDLCGVDYSAYGSDVSEDGAYLKSDDAPALFPFRFAAVYQLLSVKHNVRLRVRVFAEDDEFPLLHSVIEIWPNANWYEREAFDLFGIIFTSHPDLRRILTDYGFTGNPFRKDFPLSGTVEMRYDEELRRLVYEPVSIAPREITPRIVREENYGRHP
jgi:NADH-quinone oxidoreductase subunit C